MQISIKTRGKNHISFLQTLKDDLVEDPAFRNRQQTSEGPVSAIHFLHTYLTYMK